MLIVIMLSVVVLCRFVMLSVVMLSVIMLSVIMLNVVAPREIETLPWLLNREKSSKIFSSLICQQTFVKAKPLDTTISFIFVLLRISIGLSVVRFVANEYQQRAIWLLSTIRNIRSAIR